MLMDRKAAVAGGFYPSNPDTLKKEVTAFIEEASKRKTTATTDLKGIIVPHAGYVYSGPVAGFGYNLIRNAFAGSGAKKTVFLLGPAHFIHTTASIGMFDSFVTPLGKVQVATALCKKLLREKIFDDSVEAHLPEHSIEVQLPFLQETLADFEVVPILLGDIDPQVLAEKLQPYFGQKGTLFVISSDLSHYLPYERAVEKDRKSIEIITALDIAKSDSIDACGKTGIITAMLMAKKDGAEIKLLDYRNSGDTAGDKEAVVGYAALSVS